MGTAVFWGMLIATLVGVFLIPGLFAMVERIGLGKKKEAKVRSGARARSGGIGRSSLSMRLGYRGIVVGLVLTGCALGPSYKRPETVPVPETWRDTAQALRDSSFANVPWWSVLEDTTLQGLVRTALKENRDLHIALARVNEARALLGIQKLEAYPQINIQGRLGHSEGADSLLTGVSTSELGFLGVTLNWELDLWGRLRRLNESARAALLATEEGRRGVILIVVSEVARAYLELRDLDAQVVIADTQVSIRRAVARPGPGRASRADSPPSWT